MRIYYWFSLDAGQQQKGEVMASSKEHARQLIAQKGYLFIRLKAGIKVTSKHWHITELINIIRQLSVMLTAGLPLLNSLILIRQQHPLPGWRCLLAHLQTQIEQGNPLSEALKTYPDVFPALFQQIIAIGELTGRLDICCQQLTERHEQLWQLQLKVKKALRYPLFILSIALVVTLLMLILVLPEFADIYKSFDAPLPTFTQMIITLSEWLQSNGLILLAGIISAIAIYLKRYRPHLRWRKREQRLLLKMPICGQLIRTNALSRIFNILMMTQLSGISLPIGLNAAAQGCGLILYTQALNQVHAELEKGIPLFQALQRQTCFPTLSCQLTRIGEESGSLDAMLKKLAEIYQLEAEALADALTQKLEPILMGILGIIIGSLVIAIYLPIFQLGNIMN